MRLYCCNCGSPTLEDARQCDNCGSLLPDTIRRSDNKARLNRFYENDTEVHRCHSCRGNEGLRSYVFGLASVVTQRDWTGTAISAVISAVSIPLTGIGALRSPGKTQRWHVVRLTLILCDACLQKKRVGYSVHPSWSEATKLGYTTFLGPEDLARLRLYSYPSGTSKYPSGTVIFRSADGRILTTEDLRGATGTFRYEIIAEGGVPAEAESLHQQAREAGSRGDYKKALALLEHASQIAPRWPYPLYDAAYTCLLMQDYDAARKYYRKTVELSPRGFFTAITAVDALTREEKGELPDGTYREYVLLEFLNDLEKKAAVLRMLVKEVPQFAPGWKELATITDDQTEMLSIIEKGLAAHPDAETKGMLQMNKALILYRQGNHDAAIQLLVNLALDPNSTFGTEHSAKAALANLTRR